ncbi:transcriptional regulator, TetR family [Chitinophaga sp. CF118]|uniref:TetR/AcrR family transcriptional regulator n=1 Tax=Chitinophaga sp. CF118 TaxID=1884367 RepID=UPI0008DEC5A5|nr:TetR/AcrR family transcriptional regulator [Chitinophaga sp. CF118]SFE59370.1 transcriptional regulator, TetR family [Chitinophaga sp. CF118]
MPVKDAQTEKLIKDTAMRIFFVEGNIHAKTQEIADAAGVNRGLIYYYFKNRDHLFDVVFTEAMSVVQNRIKELFFSSKLEFREKMGQFIEFFIDNNLKYPYLEIFLITEVNVGHHVPHQEKAQITKLTASIEGELKEEIRKGSVPQMSARQFIINMISLCVYPILSKPLLKELMQLDEKGYLALVKDRKQLILKVLFRD